ncbi:uncharacterized protein PG986_000699 [Apiospora aurea]|uniref:Uncharacterized protein n=1 Tax=Apiospora aurea TaxID=335848 RepID=A0ABR1QV91_9PEZI
MPVKREASGSTESPVPSKVAKPAEEPAIENAIASIMDYIREGDLSAVSSYIRTVLVFHMNRFTYLTKEVAKLRRRQEDEDKVIQELQEQNAAPQQKLSNATKSRDECMKETQSLIRSESALRNDAARTQDENRRKTVHLEKALTMAQGLSAEIRLWKDAQKNLQSALSDDDATALDVGRANASEIPPSYLLDPFVAQKIVEHYEHQVNRSIEKMCSHLADFEPEGEVWDES